MYEEQYSQNWILGLAFLKNYYTSFDKENLEIQMAPLNVSTKP